MPEHVPYTLNPGVQSLIERPVPPLIKEQLEYLSKETIHATIVMPFDARQASEKLTEQEGSTILAADFGGDKGIVRLFKITDGALLLQDGYQDDIQGNSGEGYLDALERAAAYAEQHGIPFGLSWGTPLDGSRPIYHPKAETFLHELTQKYRGDIAAISPIVTVINDGPAGALSGAVEAFRSYGSQNTIFVINGGGINTSAVVDGQLYSNESGHVQAINALNTYHQTTACGVFGAEYVCLERLGANKVGIEAQWEAETGSYMRARNIEDEYKTGNSFAGDLYEHSAWVVGHLIAGVAQSFSLDLADTQTTVVAHGGAFKFPYYGKRVQQILADYAGGNPQFILAKDYVVADSNACLEGAAIAAAYSGVTPN